jgi:hypothetical protein
VKTNSRELLGSLLFGGVLVGVSLAHGIGASAKDVEVSTSLVSDISVVEKINESLTLKVSGGLAGFEVEVFSTKSVRGCFPNLVGYAEHGPDEYMVYPWHVRNRFYPNERSVPVCGMPYAVEISIISPKVDEDSAPENSTFLAGDLRVRVHYTGRTLPHPPRKPPCCGRDTSVDPYR